MDETKKCTACGVNKALRNFGRYRKQGAIMRFDRCSVCWVRRAKAPPPADNRPPADRSEYRQEGAQPGDTEKVCYTCLYMLPLAGFKFQANRPDKLAASCKACLLARRRVRNMRKPEREIKLNPTSKAAVRAAGLADILVETEPNYED